MFNRLLRTVSSMLRPTERANTESRGRIKQRLPVRWSRVCQGTSGKFLAMGISTHETVQPTTPILERGRPSHDPTSCSDQTLPTGWWTPKGEKCWISIVFLVRDASSSDPHYPTGLHREILRTLMIFLGIIRRETRWTEIDHGYASMILYARFVS